MEKTAAISPGQIRDELEDDIVNGIFAPAAKLDEASLSRRFGISRTPVREALRQLAASGLIELVPNRGAFVAKLSIPRLIEMFEVMAELEGMCGRLAARRISPVQIEQLLESHEDCRVAGLAGSADEYYNLNARFHEVIYQACQNGFLIEQVKQLHRRLHPYRRMQLRVARRIVESFDEHQTIVDAILSGDADRAEACLKDHLLIQGQRFNDLVAAIHNSSD